jgi:hypothetical protein
LAPQHPENHLCLLEACLRWGDRECAEREIKILDKLWPVARKNLVGENWMAAWADWESRLSQAKAKFEKLADVVTSPHSKD